LDKDAKKFGKRKQFFNKCAGTTDHLHAKEWSRLLSCTTYKIKSKGIKKSECKS
jgi:hypothetical protein